MSEIHCAADSVDQATLTERVSKTAGGLAALGIAPGDRVVLLMCNSIPFVEITLAIGHLGAVPVPVNWHFAAPEIASLLEDCDPSVIFVDEGLRDAVPDGWTGRSRIIEVTQASRPGAPDGLDYRCWRDASPLYSGDPKASPGSMVYTSGTTGRPKGVQRDAPTPEQKEGMVQVRNHIYRISPDARVLVPGPLYHAFPNQIAVHAALHADYLNVMERFDAEEMLRIIERERITSVGLAPIMFVRLLRLPDTVRSKFDVSSLRWAIHAGGPCAPDVKHAMIEWWGPVITEYYGGTETGPLTLCTSEEWLARPGTCGRPIEGARIRIIDADGRDAPVGDPGEIYGRLDSYPDFTYRGDPEKRRSVGLGDLVSLGDVGYQDRDGYVFLCDRARDMIVSGGVNIYPAEVEGALLALPQVSDCAVFGIPDSEYGEAVVACVSGQDLDADRLRRDLREKIAGYKVPREISIVSAIERDASGKLRKRDLRERYLASLDREGGIARMPGGGG